MKRQDSELMKRAYIETPCNVAWDSMVGDDRTRFCGQCNLTVYDVSNSTDQETISLMREANKERLCMKLYRRPDGTLLTDNCPVGLRKIRDKIRLRVAVAVALLVSIGIIQSAQAQGLIGAPVDPHYGQVNFTPEVCSTEKPGLDALNGITIGAAVGWLYANRRSSLSILSIGLSAIFLVAGIFASLQQIWN